jgi:hypothetical protein
MTRSPVPNVTPLNRTSLRNRRQWFATKFKTRVTSNCLFCRLIHSTSMQPPKLEELPVATRETPDAMLDAIHAHSQRNGCVSRTRCSDTSLVAATHHRLRDRVVCASLATHELNVAFRLLNATS